MNAQTTTPAEAANLTAGFIGTTAEDPRVHDLTTRWADSVADAFGTRPDLAADLSAEHRAQLLLWLDERGDGGTLTTTGDTVIAQGEPVHAAGTTTYPLTMHTGHDRTGHVVLDAGDEPFTAHQAREVAAALLEVADQIDGRESAIISTPRNTPAPADDLEDVDPWQTIDGATIPAMAAELTHDTLVAIFNDGTLAEVPGTIAVGNLIRAGVAPADVRRIIANA